MILVFHKEIGESMQNVIDRFRQEYGLKKEEKIAFAGRLDPIAFGKIKILTGDDLKNKDLICDQYKVYTYSVIHGVQTDTYDILGMITNPDSSFMEYIISDQGMTFEQPYPFFSSKTININGKMMRLWDAKLKGCITESTPIPTKTVTIFYNKILRTEKIDPIELFKLIKSRIDKVNGNFRQNEIIENWENYLKNNNSFTISHYETKISSGGYVRSLANNMGGTAYDICRQEYLTT